ncbi:hypothetical protein A9Q84_18925 [Halobacteriovorax marinus]|uniref:HTH marR-type domain-containing protein n=1 Tax=Halobacteriovorax marinus TaxID=97084 RepID=A0A1Y5F2T5_9BACT|nr:hypothetical protein A9Q84_18925 [Halobacteriovorax marinus]
MDPINVINCTCNKLRIASRVITRLYNSSFDDSKVSALQFSLLQTIKAFDGGKITTIANQLKMERTTLTRNIKPLERDGLVFIESSEDAREKIIKISSKGVKELKRNQDAWEEVQLSVIDKIGKKDWNQLLKILDKLES